MRRQRGVLVGVGLFDLRGGRQFARQLLAVGEELAGESGDRRVRQRLRRDDQVVDGDGIDLVFGARGEEPKMLPGISSDS